MAQKQKIAPTKRKLVFAFSGSLEEFRKRQLTNISSFEQQRLTRSARFSRENRLTLNS